MAGKARRVWIIVLAVVVLLLIAGLVLFFLFRDRATPVEATDITVSVRGEGPGAFGLYEYETVGYETTDALTGARHDYPAESYLTIQPGGCGVLVRWQVLQERWDEWDYCADGTLAGRQNYHEWFQIPNLDVWTCSPGVPSQGQPGETWTGICSRAAADNMEEGAEEATYEVVGFEMLTVGSEQVETLHIRTTSVGSGASSSSDTIDTWMLPGTFLVVRQVATGESASDTRIGLVNYYEEYEINLVSLQPSAPAGPSS